MNAGAFVWQPSALYPGAANERGLCTRSLPTNFIGGEFLQRRGLGNEAVLGKDRHQNQI